MTETVTHVTSTQVNPQTGFVISPDGARIAYTRQGHGPAIVLVHCVSCDRVTTPQPTLAETLTEHFTVLTYDRRGNGQSDTIEPYAVERELEDLTAVIGELDGPVDVLTDSIREFLQEGD